MSSMGLAESITHFEGATKAMAAKRASNRPAASAGGGSISSSNPLITALLLVVAIGYGISVLVTHGRISWPPHQLLASLFTVAGCLALVGPIVLIRREGGESGLGELLWMTGGLLVWVFDILAAVRGSWRLTTWATPLDNQTMGLIILAVLIAGWRCKVAGRGWSWTNVTGWVLGIFWVGLALATLWPAQLSGVAAR